MSLLCARCFVLDSRRLPALIVYEGDSLCLAHAKDMRGDASPRPRPVRPPSAEATP